MLNLSISLHLARKYIYIYILLGVLVCSIALYFYGPVERVKIQTSKSIYRLTHSASKLSGFYLHEFTNNERELSIPHATLPSAVLKISSSLIVNEYR